MSIAVDMTSPAPEYSLTVRQFRLSVLVAAGAVIFGCLIYGAEKYLFDFNKRFVENPVEMMMRAFAVAHFLMGWLFLFSSPRFRSAASLGRFGVCVTLGIALCLIYGLSGAARNPIMVMFFYCFFLVHEVRDQADLFLAYGDGNNCDRRVLTLLRRSACLLLVAVLASVYLVNALLWDRHQIVEHTDPNLLIGGTAFFGVVSAASIVQLVHHALRVHGSLAAFIAVYHPLLSVYGGILSILLIGSLLGSVGFNLIILIHVTAWLVFVHHQLQARGSTRPDRGRSLSTLWHWIRYRPVGFLTLHLALVAVVLILLALRVYVWQRGGVVSVLLSGSTFQYWSFMHIAIAFVRK